MKYVISALIILLGIWIAISLDYVDGCYLTYKEFKMTYWYEKLMIITAFLFWLVVVVVVIIGLAEIIF